MTQQVEALKTGFFALNGYTIETYINRNGQLCAQCTRVLKSGKNAGSLKLIWRYAFRTEEQRTKYADDYKIQLEKAENKKELNTQAKKTALQNFKNPYAVGQVLYDSWGYDQTNVDFYQIVEIKNRSVMMRKIGQEIVPGSEGYMCERVKPAVDSFIGEPFLRPVVTSVYNEKVNYHVNGTRGSLMEYDNREGGLYQSHYA